MTAPVSITRTDCTPAELHNLAWKSKSAIMALRLMAVAMLRKGESRNMVAETCGVTVQTLRNWIVRYNTGGPEGLADLPRPGRPPHLGTEERSALASWVETGADADADGVCRWRVVDLRNKVEATCGVSVSPETVRRTLHAMGFSHVSPRPLHPKADPARQEACRRDFRALVLDAVPDTVTAETIEVWFQDEARAGQKGMLSRGWARKGKRPRILRDQRYGYAYLFAAARPQDAVAVGHVCDRANTGEMNRHLADVSRAVTPGRHGVVVLDGAGWHRSTDLAIPDNLTLLRLPPYSPELNPIENLFGFLKSNVLANRVFPTVDDVRAAITDAWNTLCQDADRISSITTRTWARNVAPTPHFIS